MWNLWSSLWKVTWMSGWYFKHLKIKNRDIVLMKFCSEHTVIVYMIKHFNAYFCVHSNFRRKVKEILKVCGLKDDSDYLTRELDTWDVWDMDEDERPHELRRMCREWLDK